MSLVLGLQLSPAEVRTLTLGELEAMSRLLERRAQAAKDARRGRRARVRRVR